MNKYLFFILPAIILILSTSCTVAGLEDSLLGKWKITEMTIDPDNYSSKYTFDNYIWEIKGDDKYTKKGNYTYELTVDGVYNKYENSIDSSGIIKKSDFTNKTVTFETTAAEAVAIKMTYILGFNTVTFKHEYKAGDTTYTETIKGEKVF